MEEKKDFTLLIVMVYSIITLFDGIVDADSPDILDRIIAVYDDGIPCPERMKHLGFGSERGDVLEFLNDQVD